MTGLILGLILTQAAEVRITVRVVRPTCVLIDASGEATVVPRRHGIDRERTLACASSREAEAPRIEQHVEVAATVAGPEQRVVEINY